VRFRVRHLVANTKRPKHRIVFNEKRPGCSDTMSSRYVSGAGTAHVTQRGVVARRSRYSGALRSGAG
jgi:hypothetical protein